MADKKVQIIIDALDKTQAAFKSAASGVQSFGENVKAKFRSVQENWLAVTAAIAVTTIAVKKIWDSAQLAAEFEQSRQAFNGMVQKMGRDAEAEFQKIKKSSANLIDDKTITEASNRALSLGIPIEKIADLMEIARAKARDMGITTTQAFNDIVTGIGRGSPLILDNLGLTLKIGEANEQYAKSIGKIVEQLTEQDKKQAVLNATIEAGKEALTRHDLSVKTSNEVMQEFSANIENLEKNFGGMAATVLKHVVPALSDFFSLFAEGTQKNAAWQLEKFEGKISSIQKILKGEGIVGGLWNKLFLSEDEKKNLEKDLDDLLKKRQTIFETFFGVVPAGKPDNKKTTSAAPPVVNIESAKNDFQTIEQLHSIAIDNMKKKSQELLDFEKEYRDYKIESEDLLMKVQNQGKVEQEKEAVTKYYETVAELQNKQREADKLQGEERIKLLNEVMKGWEGISGEVTENGQTIISAQTAQSTAYTNMYQINRDLNLEGEKTIGLLETQKGQWYTIQVNAENALNNITAKVQNLANTKVDLNIDTTKAEAKIAAIQARINALNFGAALKSIDSGLADAAKFGRSEFANTLNGD